MQMLPHLPKGFEYGLAPRCGAGRKKPCYAGARLPGFFGSGRGPPGTVYSEPRQGESVARARYWKLEPSEVSVLSYDESKLLNWDIKLTIGPEGDASFAGVFMYRHGTPRDYEAVRGISYYHNNVPKQARADLTKSLRSRFGGDETAKGERVMLEGSREIYSGPDVASLASDLEGLLGAKAVITLEFSDFDEEEMASAGLPPAKLLPIPTN